MWLPPPERQNEIQFYVAKALPYPRRLAIAFGLMAAGLALGIVLVATPAWPVGPVVVFCGVLMLLAKGYENIVTPRGKQDWRPCTRQELERILEINKKQRKWDQVATDFTCLRGAFLLIGLAVAVWILFKIVSQTSWEAARLLVANAAVVILPFWFTGARFILKNDDLIVKTKMLLELQSEFDVKLKQEGEEFQFQIQTGKASKGGGELPVDVKGVLAFLKAPATFLGMQMQVSINQVQGNSFPYFYCVLVARPEFGGLRLKAPPPPKRKMTFSPERQDDVDILVIRQTTTKSAGYHTNQAAARQVLLVALDQARAALRDRA